MAIFVAIDGGGTKTECWVADETRVLGRAVCGSVKIMNVGEAVAAERLQSLVRDAAKAAGVDLSAVTATCFGLAGSSSAGVKAWAQTTLGLVVSGAVEVCGDEEIALDAAFGGGAGVFVICGTGANVVGRCEDGSLVTAGGWGPVLGDEGSGQWIGLEAVRAALKALDRGAETMLLREVMAFWKLQSLSELVAVGNQQPRPEFAELAETVARCAEAGDAVAQDVLQRAGSELAVQVRLVVEKMKAKGNDVKRVAFAGSVLRLIAPVRQALEAGLVGIEVDAKATEPLEGALFRTRQKSKPLG
jgi:N-acetylglucosamine kinase-like BadF-type ATPase